MRPLELRLRNFRSYFGDEAVFDFRGRRLVGIVGPIGSGKSSILDAISFALYGRTPTVGAATKTLIHQRAGEAAVLLRFEVEGEIWEAVRMLRRKGASQHALYRYETDDDAEPVEKVLLEGEVNARVGELLGLEFDAFGRSVLLAQGRFAEFLRSRPAERDKVLKGVFGHDRLDAMREVARARAGAAAVEVEKLTVRVEQVERLVSEIGELNASTQVAIQRRDALRRAEPEVTALDSAFSAAGKAASDAERRLTELRAHGRRLPDALKVDAVIAKAGETGSARDRVAKALDDAREKLAAAEADAAAARDGGAPQIIEKATALVATVAPLRSAVDDAALRRDRVAARLASQRIAVEEAGAAALASGATLDDAVETAEAAAADLKAAAAALHEAQHAEMAGALRSGLAVGDPCPVCARAVAEVPAAIDAPELETARERHVGAVSARQITEAARALAGEENAVAVKSEETARAAVVRLEGEVAAGSAEVQAAQAKADDIALQLEGLLGEGDPEQLLSARRDVLAGLGARAAEAREATDRARLEHDQAIRDEQEAGNALGGLRVDLVDTAARMGFAIDDEEPGSPAAVAAFYAMVRSKWGEAVGAVEGGLEDATRDKKRTAAAREAMLAAFDIAGDFAAALGEAVARADLIQAEIRRRDAEVRDSGDVAARRDEAAHIRATYDRVASDLTDAKFVRYLLDEERTRLAALGSDHFLRLSSGRYLFSDDGRFDIIDQTSADAVRRAESLSGGETFLASLALALSLAEMVARTGGRLDAFFLDEGFGTLDPEHLDLAMDGIEALVAGAGERFVVVVSHVRELHDRIEDLIILDRNTATGDTRVLQA